MLRPTATCPSATPRSCSGLTFQFAVFDLQGNNILFNGQHYVSGNVLFAGLPHCGSSNSGDIIAQWDKIAHRWVMYQPRFSPVL